jgi:hypothetical protein
MDMDPVFPWAAADSWSCPLWSSVTITDPLPFVRLTLAGVTVPLEAERATLPLKALNGLEP